MVALLFCMRTMNPIFRITNNIRKGGNTMLLIIIKILDMIFSVSGIVYFFDRSNRKERRNCGRRNNITNIINFCRL